LGSNGQSVDSVEVAEPSRTLYDEIGSGYARHRRADPRLAALITAALGDARSVVDVGAGTGSYEPDDRWVVAVEPSAVMLAQRSAGSAPAVQAVAEALPFPNGRFDAAMVVLSVHHWEDPRRGLAELRRVARRRVVLAFDPDVHQQLWLMDYIPELAEVSRGPSVEDVAGGIGADRVSVVPVPHDCVDAMTIANWRRPHAYLDPETRACGSAFRLADSAAVARGIERLAEDLASGRWQRRYGDLLERDELDLGLRLIVAG